MKRISLYPLVVLVFAVASSWAQNSLSPDTWLRTLKNSNGDYSLKEDISDKILHQVSLNESTSLINFNPVMPVYGLDSVLASLHYLPKTMISVVSSDFANEQAIWSLSDSAGVLALMTNKRMADLSNYNYMNFPQRIFPQPLLSTYVHEHGRTEDATEYLLRIGNPGIGNLPIDHFTGSIAEVMLYDRVLSREDRNVIESYLAIKYGLTLTGLQSPQYVDAEGNILWDGLLDKDYNYRIAGIGRDDFTGLYQKQSASSVEPDGLIISVGACADENAENVASLPDGAFLLWGDNNAPMVLEESVGQKLLFQRKWKMSATNWQDSLSTSMRFDRSKINTFLNDNEMYWLVIDREGKRHFTGSSLEYFPAIMTTDKIEFHGITWDTDHSAGDHFTLMIGPKLFAQVAIKQPSCGTDHSGSLHIGAVGGTPPYAYAVHGPAGYREQWTSMDRSVQLLENLSPGKYTIRLRDADLLEYEEMQLLAHSAMQGDGIDQQYFLPEAGTLSIDLSDLDFDELRWTFPTGQEVTTQIVAVTEPGIYTVLGEKDGCISVGTIDIRRRSESPFHDVVVYPNPTTTGEFQLDVELDEAGDLEISLHTAAGHLIDHHLLFGRKNFTYKDRISGSPGAYIITVRAHGHSVSIPLIYR